MNLKGYSGFIDNFAVDFIQPRWLLIAATMLMLASCVGPPALHQTVLGYDQTTTELEQEILLINIARLSQESPPHFTVTDNIAATFDFTTSANVGGNVKSSPGINDFDLRWSSSASEKPTYSIVPISGKEFTKRIIRPCRIFYARPQVFNLSGCVNTSM